MKLDATVDPGRGDVAAQARTLEAQGYDGVWAAETAHDPFVQLALAARATSRATIGTGIAVAFARTPMTTAVAANDLQLLSEGRFVLGLGSQIKAHIEKRYSMPWSQPAERMREFVGALHQIWSCWNEGTPLRVRGQFYRHTLMTPFFNPGPNPYGRPRVFVAAVGERMTAVAGDVADGLLVHSFTTERYVREVTLPIVERSLAARGLDRGGFELQLTGLVATGETDEEMAAAVERVKSQIAFYGSTPAYRGVLALHGWADLHDELHRASLAGEWSAMSDLVGEDVVEAFAVVAPVDQVAARVRERWGGVIDRFSLYFADELRPAWRAAIAEGLRAP